LALFVLLLTPEFFLPLRQLALKYHAGAAGKAAARRIFAIRATHPGMRSSDASSEGHWSQERFPSVESAKMRESERAAVIQVQQACDATTTLCAQYDLHFHDVHFAYANGQRPALRGFTLTIPHGGAVALVGATGAGKTTVANLLLRFIDPDRGSVTAGGVPLTAMGRVAWRRQVAWVPQLPYLFHGTVVDNLRLARPAASMEEVVAAARAAHADGFIRALPQGYYTALGERGARLSGGQQQRLAMARAFLKDAPVLVLDEATAHLDYESETLIQDALARLRQARTVLIITHRLKLACVADRIVVIDQGHAIERGDPGTLLSQASLYESLVTAQGQPA
jgi:ABC-type multidrug transport system fused ATPase/permease subunit